MNKEIQDDEVEFPDDIISFLKVKYPKAHTDQEKAVLKQIEQLTEEKKELKDIISKKREQAKIKSLPLNVVPSEEAKEKAIKLVQDGTLLLSSKAKQMETDEPVTDTTDLPIPSQKLPKTSDPTKSSGSSSKISFVSAGFAFSDNQASKSTTDEPQSTKRTQMPFDASSQSQKKPRLNQHRIPSDASSSDDSDTPQNKSGPTDREKSHVLRFCGHNMNEEFVRRIVEQHASIGSLQLERRNDNSSNVIVTLDSPETARIVKEALDSQYIEGRVVNVYFKRGGSDFQRRPFRRRRFRDFGRGRNRNFRNESFQPMEYDTGLPSYFNSNSGDNDEMTSRRMRWSVSEDNESSDQSGRLGIGITSSNLKTQAERSLVPYDDLDPN